MKKIIFIILFILLFIIAGNIGEAKVIIPNESIRLRVIPNSNNEEDQKVKLKLKNELQNSVTNIIKDANDINEAEKLINDNLDEINKQIQKFLLNEKSDLNYKINFGYNYFPKKVYNNVTYNEGYYESLVVTLGKGQGDNWWCVLFPPLCLMEAEESDTVEYTSIIKEIIDKYKKS